MWLVAVHGQKADWVRNLESTSQVRLKHRGRWSVATAAIEPFDPSIVARFNAYARTGPRTIGIDAVLVRLSFEGRT